MKQKLYILIIGLCFTIIGLIFYHCSSNSEIILEGNELFNLIIQDTTDQKLYVADISTEFDKAYIRINENTDTTALIINTIKISYKASANYQENDFITLKKREFSILITAENKNTKVYTIKFINE